MTPSQYFKGLFKYGIKYHNKGRLLDQMIKGACSKSGTGWLSQKACIEKAMHLINNEKVPVEYVKVKRFSELLESSQLKLAVKLYDRPEMKARVEGLTEYLLNHKPEDENKEVYVEQIERAYHSLEIVSTLSDLIKTKQLNHGAVDQMVKLLLDVSVQTVDLKIDDEVELKEAAENIQTAIIEVINTLEEDNKPESLDAVINDFGQIAIDHKDQIKSISNSIASIMKNFDAADPSKNANKILEDLYSIVPIRSLANAEIRSVEQIIETIGKPKIDIKYQSAKNNKNISIAFTLGFSEGSNTHKLLKKIGTQTGGIEFSTEKLNLPSPVNIATGITADGRIELLKLALDDTATKAAKAGIIIGETMAGTDHEVTAAGEVDNVNKSI